ncbi:QWRF motif-containing protein 2 [Citrus sinensis]|uniref:QWRF motif-containing protein 2 n=1 Tax=Citrus sinensis TaxID=2711 RepID=A0ACB8IDL8_CITSI|nr:QWRF motif-containing protein 2 [Citrus sinensis]
MVAAISDENPTTSSRPPLLPSEKDNARSASGVNGTRKPRGRLVSSRYLSPSPSSSSSSSSTTATASAKSQSQSQRFSSPLLSRSTNSSNLQSTFPALGPKRSQSVDRRRPVTGSSPRATTPVPSSKQSNSSQELSTATKMLITSTRSLSVSFQGEAFSLPISKTKAKATPERRRGTPVRDQPWPGRSRQGNPSLSRSLDCSVEGKKFVGFGSGAVAKSLNQSLIENESRLNLDLDNAKQNKDGNLLVSESCDLVTSDDTDSVSSGSTNTSGVPESGGALASRMKNGARGIIVSARFWQETNSRLRRLQDPGSPLSTSPGSRTSNPSKFLQSKRFSSDSAVSTPPRTMASPIRGANRPSSPNKSWNTPCMSPSRGIPSPARVRNGVGGILSGNSSNTPSILSFSVDLKRGKMGEDRIVDAHMLRLLHNRYLQWRFVNARADATFMVQQLNAEQLIMMWLVFYMNIDLTEFPYLEEWALLDKDHTNSLLGATEALKASTLRLPVVGKAIADVQNLKDAISSALDVMQAMASSICLLSSKVENMNSLTAELMSVTAKEMALLEQCKDFSSTLSALQLPFYGLYRMMSCVACLFVHMMSVYSMNLLNPAVSELNMTVH